MTWIRGDVIDMNNLLDQVLLFLGIAKERLYSEHCKVHEKQLLLKPRWPTDPRGAFGSIEELVKYTYGSTDPYLPRDARKFK